MFGFTLIKKGTVPAWMEEAAVWDAPPTSKRCTVYYEDEDIPDDAVPLYRLAAS